MSILKVDTINEKTTGNGVYIPNHVVQVKQGVMTSREVINTTSYTAIGSGFTVSITPSSSSSKIFITTSMNLIINAGTAGLVKSALLRDTTEIQNLFHYEENTASGYWSALTMCHQFLDSPSTTNQITYSAKFQNQTGSCYLNYSNVNLAPADNNACRSTFTAMEIAQ